jgi:hypothetical protein
MIDQARILVWVHTWHGRSDPARAATLRSLDMSDAAGRYEVMCQPVGVHRDDFYMATLRSICARRDIDYMIRLEDDVVVSRHLLHNVSRWKATRHSRFGAGWLSVTDELLADEVNCPKLDGFRIREFPECHFAGGVLMGVRALSAILPFVEERLRAGGKNFAPGCSLSRAVWKSGQRVFFHEPSIVSIDMNIPAYHPRRKNELHFDKQPYDQNWRVK